MSPTDRVEERRLDVHLLSYSTELIYRTEYVVDQVQTHRLLSRYAPHSDNPY